MEKHDKTVMYLRVALFISIIVLSLFHVFPAYSQSSPPVNILVLNSYHWGLGPFQEAIYTKTFDSYPGEYVMLAVTDNGMGMDDDTKANIFEPFFTTKEVGKGTGLGLATCYGIVKQNNGYIWVYSEKGSGTTFKVYLPRDTEMHQSSEVKAAKAVVNGGTETVLVVEDEEAVKTMLTRTLRECGYIVHHASDGVEALELIEKDNIEPEILITDAVMPNMGGKELHEKMLEIYPTIKTLYISGYTGNVLSLRGMNSGKAEIIQKPFTRDALLIKIRTMLDP